jgi:hypothetical protein
MPTPEILELRAKHPVPSGLNIDPWCKQLQVDLLESPNQKPTKVRTEVCSCISERLGLRIAGQENSNAGGKSQILPNVHTGGDENVTHGGF